MKIIKTIAAAAISTALLAGCNSDNNIFTDPTSSQVSIATFNLSFDCKTFEQLVTELKFLQRNNKNLLTVS